MRVKQNFKRYFSLSIKARNKIVEMSDDAWLVVSMKSQLEPIYGRNIKFIHGPTGLEVIGMGEIPPVIRHYGMAQVWSNGSSNYPITWQKSILEQLLPTYFECIVEDLDVFVSREVYNKFDFPGRIVQILDDAWQKGIAHWPVLFVDENELLKIEGTLLSYPKFQLTVQELELGLTMEYAKRRAETFQRLSAKYPFVSKDMRFAIIAKGAHIEEGLVVAEQAPEFIPKGLLVSTRKLNRWKLVLELHTNDLFVYSGNYSQEFIEAVSLWNRAYIETPGIMETARTIENKLKGFQGLQIGPVTSRIYCDADPEILNEILRAFS